MGIVNRASRLWITAGLGTFALSSLSFAQHFTPAERAWVVDYWKSKAKYSAEPAMLEDREWTVRLTPAGSIWIREVYKQFQASKVNPTKDPEGNTPEQREWAGWIDRQVKRDWAAAEMKARALNAGGAPAEEEPPAKPSDSKFEFDRKKGTDKVDRLLLPQANPAPQDECPAALVALVGPPPCFSAPVRPLKHTIVYPDGQSLVYTDNVKVRAKYAYYRFAAGVNSGGQKMKSLPDEEINGLCRSAGISGKIQRVMKAVSLLEGGFDSINTYDTGFVSVGFIQFACLADGSGSLGKMMALYKATEPDGFNQDFRRYGLDVEGNRLVAMDLETGEESVGAEAAQQIIHDKRLISVFQRAGLKSPRYRVAQLLAAKSQFYPGDDLVTVNLNGVDKTVRLSDIFKSEAGLATLMDRKVNTGKIAGLKECIERCAAEYAINEASELPLLEFVLAKELAYRTDYTSATALGKPRDNTTELSRRGSRLDRNKKDGSRKGSRSGRG